MEKHFLTHSFWKFRIPEKIFFSEFNIIRKIHRIFKQKTFFSDCDLEKIKNLKKWKDLNEKWNALNDEKDEWIKKEQSYGN